MTENRRHRVIIPTSIETRRISELKQSVNGDPYYWFELEDMEYGYVAARTMWGKRQEDGLIRWERIGRDELIDFLSTEEGLKTMRDEVKFVLINLDDWRDVLGPDERNDSPAIIWFSGESLEKAVRTSRKSISSGSAKTRHILAVNRDRGGTFDPYN